MVRCAIACVASRIAVAAILLPFALAPVRAEVLLQGDAAAVRLEVTQATVGEILSSLNRDYGLRYRATIALDRTLTGTYTGSLPRIIARVLDGYDFITRVTSDGVEVPYIRTRGSVAPTATAVTVNKVILPMEVGQLLKVSR